VQTRAQICCNGRLNFATDSTVAIFEATMEVVPRGRVDAIDVRAQAVARYDGAFDRYPRCLYYSPHTTAGYLPQSLSARLRAEWHGVGLYVDLLRAVFPEGAGYQHDDLGQRHELTPVQRLTEPLNGDSHLAFIGGGLHACVSYRTDRPGPVHFIDLDGVAGGTPRRRSTRLIGYDREIELARVSLPLPVSPHPVDALNLKEPEFAVYDQIAALIDRYGLASGRVRIALGAGEQGASLTVNEYETLLMRHDLAEVLRNPMRFAAEKARHVWENPGAVPAKAMDYAKYDFVRAVSRFVDAAGLGASWIERLLGLAIGVPASRFLGSRRSIDLLVSDSDSPGQGRIVEGRFRRRSSSSGAARRATRGSST
jgi:hypothetical protein